jgi:hypothetical protein
MDACFMLLAGSENAHVDGNTYHENAHVHENACSENAHVDENACVWYMLMRTRADAVQLPKKTIKGSPWMARMLRCCLPLCQRIRTKQMMNKKRRCNPSLRRQLQWRSSLPAAL